MSVGTKNSGYSGQVLERPATGLCAGTTVLTKAGPTFVEDLQPNTLIITRNSGFARLISLKSTIQTIDLVKIKRGSLGHFRPSEDTILPADARIHVRDWRAQALYGKSACDVAGRRLVDGEFVQLLPRQKAQVIDLAFENQEILYADGMEVLSVEV